jgi:hypothetical protein
VKVLGDLPCRLRWGNSAITLAKTHAIVTTHSRKSGDFALHLAPDL